MQKCKVVPLFYKRLIQTDGDSVSWSYIDLDLPQVADWGPPSRTTATLSCALNFAFLT